MQSLGRLVRSDFRRNRYVYLMALPVVAYYVIFHYVPIYGLVIAFKDFAPRAGILESPWVGLEHFASFFNSYYAVRVIRNTILINIYQLVFSFPAPIILALLLNEVRSSTYKRSIQTITYLPHFISLVVVCGFIRDFTASDGVINDIIAFLGGERSGLLGRPELFRTIFVTSGIWQEIGWGSIIYLAALAGIDPGLYESATIDGAGRLKQTWYITLPGIMPTIVILLILRIGKMMSVGFEKIILLYSPITYETADVISSFIYRRGLVGFEYSYATAVGLFNSIINFLMLIGANWLSRRFSETSLW
jgi:putative aldouronate transport system permease protein